MYLNSQHVECEGTLVSRSNGLQDKVDDGEIVDTYLILLIADIRLHGNQSERA